MEHVLLFDFDGVIADSLEIYHAAYTAVCTEMGYKRINSREVFLKMLEGNPFRQLLWSGFPLFRLRRIAHTFEPRIREAQQRIRPFETMPAIVTDLAGKFPLYIVTSNTSDAVEQFLERHDIRHVRGVLGSDVDTSKTRKIRRVAKLHPHARLHFVSDTKGDLLEARRAKADPIAVLWGYHAAETLAQAKPSFMAESPAQLRAHLWELESGA
ncbi:MAG TPA: HAD family hydrolase [Candidatus Hydrogenedentes bacterium]|nr:HAD family hydrolase [Candidatus Hydrogenedentota bacterium]